MERQSQNSKAILDKLTPNTAVEVDRRTVPKFTGHTDKFTPNNASKPDAKPEKTVIKLERHTNNIRNISAAAYKSAAGSDPKPERTVVKLERHAEDNLRDTLQAPGALLRPTPDEPAADL